LARDLTRFALENKIIDPTFQKAFLEGVSGCVEHAMVMQEMVKNARATKRTVHITSLDLQDAFGSVEPSLLLFVMERNGVPPRVRNYVMNFLQQRCTRVQVGKDSTSEIQLKKGTPQGDSLSSILFLLAINIILKYLLSEEKNGYEFRAPKGQVCDLPRGVRIISLPFADDFSVSTSRFRTHQRILTSLLEKLKSVFLTLKPQKCVSLSICSGVFKPVEFSIGQSKIPTANKVGLRILGSHFSPLGKSSETVAVIMKKLVVALERVDSAKIRDEYRVRIANEYVIPAMRFILTVHDLPQTRVQELHTTYHRFIKKWSGLPRAATGTVLYHDGVFGLRSVTQTYLEEHVLSYVRMRLTGDAKVNDVLDWKLLREQKRKIGGSTIVESDKILLQAEATEILREERVEEKQTSAERVKICARKLVAKKFRGVYETHLKTLLVQGKFLDIIEIQNGDRIWKSIMYDLPFKQLRFLLQSAIDAAPTAANLKRWGLSVGSEPCKLCGGYETLLHVLNNCPRALQDGRYTWRHNSVLFHIVKQMRESGFVGEFFADLPGFRASGGGTIPQISSGLIRFLIL